MIAWVDPGTFAAGIVKGTIVLPFAPIVVDVATVLLKPEIPFNTLPLSPNLNWPWTSKRALGFLVPMPTFTGVISTVPVFTSPITTVFGTSATAPTPNANAFSALALVLGPNAKALMAVASE